MTDIVEIKFFDGPLSNLERRVNDFLATCEQQVIDIKLTQISKKDSGIPQFVAMISLVNND